MNVCNRCGHIGFSDCSCPPEHPFDRYRGYTTPRPAEPTPVAGEREPVARYRFKETGVSARMEQHPEGSWVQWEDVAARLRAPSEGERERERLIELLEEINLAGTITYHDVADLLFNFFGRTSATELRDGLVRLAYPSGLPFSEKGRMHSCPVCHATEIWPHDDGVRAHFADCWLGRLLSPERALP